MIAVPTTYAGSEMTPVWGLTEAEQKRTGRLIRPSARYTGHGPRPIEDVKGFRAR